ncbi:hypothetical protein ABVK25_012131 [Lepraria finkii]|uniref:non-specific serine/threonine protein kinase n=1 Tax=Lepraria finkii TaxID=1340010 RepID=A0ABR4AHZ4_9LECA
MIAGATPGRSPRDRPRGPAAQPAIGRRRGRRDDGAAAAATATRGRRSPGAAHAARRRRRRRGRAPALDAGGARRPRRASPPNAGDGSRGPATVDGGERRGARGRDPRLAPRSLDRPPPIRPATACGPRSARSRSRRVRGAAARRVASAVGRPRRRPPCAGAERTRRARGADGGAVRPRPLRSTRRRRTGPKLSQPTIVGERRRRKTPRAAVASPHPPGRRREGRGRPVGVRDGARPRGRPRTSGGGGAEREPIAATRRGQPRGSASGRSARRTASPTPVRAGAAAERPRRRGRDHVAAPADARRDAAVESAPRTRQRRRGAGRRSPPRRTVDRRPRCAARRMHQWHDHRVKPGPPPLADAADPLGKLQRGLGSGYLWVLDADRAVAHALLMHCVFNDPRWDRQLDDRDDYHATLALDLQLHTGALELWLHDSDEDDANTTNDVLGMLGRMAVRGHADARRVLREYVAYGHFWTRAIDQLIGDYDALRAGTPWPELVARPRHGRPLEALRACDDDDATVRRRCAGGARPARAAVDDVVRCESAHRARLRARAQRAGSASADAPAAFTPAKRRMPRERSTGQRPREMSTATLLRIAEDSRWTQIADELALRAESADVDLLLAAANDPDAPMRRAAILALGRQGRSELLAIAQQATDQAQRGKLQGAIALALEAMPLSQTRALAHDWLESADWARRRKAAGMLATWAEDEDLEPARRALSRELDEGLRGDVYVVGSLCEALGRCGVHGPFEELLRAYEETPYSYGRRYVVAALAASDPTFDGDVAVECLWDCEAETRRIAATHVDRRVRLAAQRLEELAGDEAQAAAVRAAARAIPEEISCLRRLQRLDLQSNILSSLPPLDALEGLYILDLSENRFERLPATIFDLPSLQLLFANTNQLVELPSAIGRLTQLEVLMANGNRIRELPREMAQLTKLLNLDLERNPLRDPLSSLLTAGTSDLFSYLRSLDDARPQYEGKLLLVGEGEVGKSSLVAAVNATAFLEGRDSTHGIELTPLHFRHPALPLDMLLNAWDFGGQEIYRITHQFFFTRRAIYLVVWKPRQGQDDNAIEDWCRRISLRVGNEAKILIVATHASHRVAELDYPQLKAKFGDVLVGNHVVDNENGTGISELRSAIARHAAELPQMGEIVSAAWQAARTELLQLSEAQIPYERFGEICAGHGLDGNATRALARMLHNLGRIIHYDEDDGLRDVVVLQPEWLTKAISYVLEDAPTRSANGLLDHHRLPEIWDADELGGYSARDHPFFLRLMEKFDVSYRIPDTQQSLVGQLVPYERPEIPWSKSARTRTLSLRCLLSEPVDGLIGWLTVRHHRFSVGTHWRRGVFVEHREWGSQALLELVGARQLDLTVSGPSPDAFASILRDGIEYLIAQRWEGLSYELLVPCRGALEDGSPCPESFKFRHLIRDREDGDSETRCPECRTRFDVSELLTGFAPERGSLQGELQAIQERIAEVGADVADIKAVTSASANQVRLVLRAVSEEVIDCPRLFTLVPLARKGSGALRFWETTSQLTLWCEHADHEHPWREASW